MSSENTVQALAGRFLYKDMGAKHSSLISYGTKNLFQRHGKSGIVWERNNKKKTNGCIEHRRRLEFRDWKCNYAYPCPIKTDLLLCECTIDTFFY